MPIGSSEISALNAEFLTKLMKLAPEEPFPHLAMADLLQEQDELQEAAQHWTKQLTEHDTIQHCGPTSPPSRQKFAVRKSVESRMTAKSSTHFVVKFDGEEDQNTWISALEILEEAYREIGQKFDHFPQSRSWSSYMPKIPFKRLLEARLGPMDSMIPPLGRIQIPTHGAITDRKWLTSVSSSRICPCPAS